jgi:hypothetical protein
MGVYCRRRCRRTAARLCCRRAAVLGQARCCISGMQHRARRISGPRRRVRGCGEARFGHTQRHYAQRHYPAQPSATTQPSPAPLPSATMLLKLSPALALALALSLSLLPLALFCPAPRRAPEWHNCAEAPQPAEPAGTLLSLLPSPPPSVPPSPSSLCLLSLSLSPPPPLPFSLRFDGSERLILVFPTTPHVLVPRIRQGTAP